MRQLIGGNFKPRFVGNWYKEEEYNALSVVLYQGASYISKTNVPSGVEISNKKYWFLYADVNIQFNYLKDDFNNLRNTITEEIENFKKVIENENENLNDEVKEKLNDEVNKITLDLSSRFDNAQQEIDNKIVMLENTINNDVEEQAIINNNLSNRISNNYNNYIEYTKNNDKILSIYDMLFKPIDLSKGTEISDKGIRTYTGVNTHFGSKEYLYMTPSTKIIIDKDLVKISNNLRLCFYGAPLENDFMKNYEIDLSTEKENKMIIIQNILANDENIRSYNFIRAYLETNEPLVAESEDTILNRIELHGWIRYII